MKVISSEITDTTGKNWGFFGSKASYKNLILMLSILEWKVLSKFLLLIFKPHHTFEVQFTNTDWSEPAPEPNPLRDKWLCAKN